MAETEARGSPGSAPAVPAPNHAHRRRRRAPGACAPGEPPGCYAAIVASSSGFFHDATLLSICVWQVYSLEAIRPGM